MTSAMRSHGCANSCVPMIETRARPVSANPTPMTTVPCDCAHRSARTNPLSDSTVARRVRSVNGSRIEGRNRLIARPMWATRMIGNKGAGIERDCRVGAPEEHTSELQSQSNLVCRLLLEKKKNTEHKKRTKKIAHDANWAKQMQ